MYFKKHNVSLLEFVDFFESSNSSMAELAKVKVQLAEATENLNLTVAKEL